MISRGRRRQRPTHQPASVSARVTAPFPKSCRDHPLPVAATLHALGTVSAHDDTALPDAMLIAAARPARVGGTSGGEPRLDCIIRGARVIPLRVRIELSLSRALLWLAIAAATVTRR